MSQLIDITKLHKKTVLTIEGPKKRFSSTEGTREKFALKFVDGYEAEFCPLVAAIEPLPKSGQEITFKVKHRGNFGDEIELAQVEGNEHYKPSLGNAIISMNGHPATIALNAAVKIKEMMRSGEGAGIKSNIAIKSDVLDIADSIHEWLLNKCHQ